jgi:hypothetical protein
MALDTAFELLQQRLHDLQTVLDELEVFITDKPERGGDVIVVGRLSDAVDDFRGWLEPMRHAISTGLQASSQPGSLEQARRSLMTCQERFNQLSEQATKTGLLSFDSIGALVDLGGRRGGEWAEWANIVRQAIEHCRHATHRMNDALYTGWRELTEQRLGRSLVSLQTTNIGQHISMPESNDAII